MVGPRATRKLEHHDSIVKSLPFDGDWDKRAHNNKLDRDVLAQSSESFSPSPSRHNPPPGDPDFPNTRLLNIEITRRMNASTDDAIKKKLKYLFELINLGPMEGDRNQMRTFMTIRSVATVSDDKANNPEETVKLLLEFL